MGDKPNPPNNATPGQRRDAFGAYHFNVILEIEGVKDSYFRSCSGLKSEAEVQEVAEGGVNDTTHKLIGRTKYPNIVLKQGFSGPQLWQLRVQFLEQFNSTGADSKALLNRYEQSSFSSFDKPEVAERAQSSTAGPKITRFSGTIVQLGPNNKSFKWRFEKAWICKWEGPDFDASKNEVSVETIEIAHEGLFFAGSSEK
jgi:phage tail-like protein